MGTCGLEYNRGYHRLLVKDTYEALRGETRANNLWSIRVDRSWPGAWDGTAGVGNRAPVSCRPERDRFNLLLDSSTRYPGITSDSDRGRTLHGGYCLLISALAAALATVTVCIRT